MTPQPGATTADVGPGQAAGRFGRRPLGVVLLVAFALITGVQSILAGFGVVGARPGSLGSLFADPNLFQLVTFAIGAISLAIAVGIWQLRPAGWYAMMLIAGAGLLLQIVLYFVGTANLLTMAVYVAAAFYLNQRAVKALFLGERTEATTVVLSREEELDT